MNESIAVERLSSVDAALARQLNALFDDGKDWDEEQGPGLSGESGQPLRDRAVGGAGVRFRDGPPPATHRSPPGQSASL